MAMGSAERIRADPVRSEEIGLMADELIGGEVEDCGVDVADVVCDQELVALLDEGEIVLLGSVDDIAIGNGEVANDVVTAREVEGVGTVSAREVVMALAAIEGVVALAAFEDVVKKPTFEGVVA